MIKASRVEYSKQFQKQLKKSSVEIKQAFLRRRELFLEDPLNPTLNNHSLIGNYLGKRSINITGDWRAIYSEGADEEGEEIITFHNLGTHSQLYE